MVKLGVRRGRARLLGIGLQNNDGHLRVSCGRNIRLYSGDESVHSRMQEKAMAFMHQVETRGLSMDNISREECQEILAEIGLQEEELIAN